MNLTDEDRAAIEKYKRPLVFENCEFRHDWSNSFTTMNPAVDLEGLAKHFLRAGMERAARICDAEEERLLAMCLDSYQEKTAKRIGDAIREAAK